MRENQGTCGRAFQMEEKSQSRSSQHSAAETNLTSIHEDAGSVWSLASLSEEGSGVAISCGVRRRRGSRFHVAVAMAQASSCSSDSTPIAWEPPYAARASLKKEKKKKKIQSKGPKVWESIQNILKIRPVWLKPSEWEGGKGARSNWVDRDLVQISLRQFHDESPSEKKTGFPENQIDVL